jgi:hypothetical protein
VKLLYQEIFLVIAHSSTFNGIFFQGIFLEGFKGHQDIDNAQHLLIEESLYKFILPLLSLWECS